MIIRSLRLRHGRIALPRQLSRRWHTTLGETTAAASAERAALPQFVQAAAEKNDAIKNIVQEVPINDPNHPVAQDYAFFKHQTRYTQNLGSSLAKHYRPHELLTNPPKPRDITLELLIASQAHIGHSTSLWNPSNARYIFGVRGHHDPIHIISPDATASHLRRACKIVNGVAERGGLILFVGTREGQARAVVRAAELAKGCHLFTKWIPGSITNGQQILGKCQKKVVNELDVEVSGFEDQLFAKAAVKPDLVVCLNPLENYVLLHECGLNNIPTIGVVDTDVNPTWVTYPIPANDDSLRCIQVIAGVLGRAGEEGQQLRQAAARRGHVVYPAIHGLNAPEKTKSDRRRPREERPIRASASPEQVAAAETAANAQNFPDDLENVDVRQHAADAALLEEAERTLREQQEDLPLATREETQNAAPAEELSFVSGVETADEDASADVYEQFNNDVHNQGEDDEDVTSIDQSLIDENYAQAVDETSKDEDLAQFGLASESKTGSDSVEGERVKGEDAVVHDIGEKKEKKD